MATQAEGSTSDRIALVVLGMHRSGTSALTGALARCGVGVPSDPIPANPHNPSGYFESEALYQLHDELFEESGTVWSDPRPFPSEWFEGPRIAEWVELFAGTVSDRFRGERLLAIKDPRLCRLVPFWSMVFERLDVIPRYILQIRHPLEVARSVSAVQGLDQSTAQLLWLDYFFASERDTRDARRTFVSYADLLADAPGTLARIERELGVDLPVVQAERIGALSSFLEVGHRHHDVGALGFDCAGELRPWLEEGYALARGACAGDVRVDEIDRLRESFRRETAMLAPALSATEVRRAMLARKRGDLEKRIGDLEEQISWRTAQARELSEELAAVKRTSRIRRESAVEGARREDRAALDAATTRLAVLEKELRQPDVRAEERERALSSALGAAEAAGQENERLRVEVEHLKVRIRALEDRRSES